MARYKTTRDGLIQSRWRLFLEPIVGSARAVPVAALDDALKQRYARKGDGRSAIYSYLRGTSTVSAEKAFGIGEALRDCGVAWCSGPIALHGAGYLGEFVRLLARLAPSDSPEIRLLAPALGAFGPIANYHVASPAWIESLTEVGYRVDMWRDFAREHLAQYTAEVGEGTFDRAFSAPRVSSDEWLDRLAESADVASHGYAERALTGALEEWAIEAAPSGLTGPLRGLLAGAAIELAEARKHRLERIHMTPERFAKYSPQRAAVLS